MKWGLSPSRVEEVVDELLHHAGVYLKMAETKRAEGHCCADIQCPVPDEDEGGELARHSTIKDMGPPHRSDLGAWAKSREQRAVCGGGHVVEVEVVVEVSSESAEKQCR